MGHECPATETSKKLLTILQAIFASVHDDEITALYNSGKAASADVGTDLVRGHEWPEGANRGGVECFRRLPRELFAPPLLPPMPRQSTFYPFSQPTASPYTIRTGHGSRGWWWQKFENFDLDADAIVMYITYILYIYVCMYVECGV